MAAPHQAAGILGIGAYAPAKVLTNADLAKIVDTSDEWIFSRTGIRERRIAADGEFTSDLAKQAAARAIADAGLEAKDIEYILLATACPDNPFPNTASWVSKALGITDVGCLDISTACSGFVYALELAGALVDSGRYKRVLAIGAEKLSAITDYTDRGTCVLFGDGAGAAVVGQGGHRLVCSRSTCDFNYDALHIKSGGARSPFTHEAIEKHEHCIRMNGREVYRFVVDKMVGLTKEALDRAGLKPTDVALFVPHQANSNMLEYAADKAGIPRDRLFVNIERYGNTSGASVPMALDEAVKAGRVKKGDYVLLVAFGGGLSSAYSVIQW